MGISAGNKKMVGGHFISDIIDSDVLKILLGTREVFSAYVFVWKTKTFSYTGADQVFEVPEDCNMTIECWGAGSNNASGGYAKGVIPVTKGQKLSFMIGGKGSRTDNGTTYGFGGSTTYGGRGGGGLSGVFTGDTTITDSDSARALVIGGGAGGGRTGGGAGGGENGQNGNGGSYGFAGGGGTQTAKGSGNQTGGQFHGGGGSGTYGFGGGGGWFGGGGSGGDGSGDDDAQAGGGSGYVLSSATDRVLTQGGGSAAGQDGSVKIRYLAKERPQPTPTHTVRLPLTYQEVDYIESSGTQYINTGYIPNVNTEIETRLSWGSSQIAWAVFYGVTSNDKSSDGILGRLYYASDTGNTRTYNWWFCNAEYAETRVETTNDVFHDIKSKKNVCTFDGTEFAITTTGTPYQAAIFLFCGNNGGSAWRYANCKMGDFVIKEGDEKKRHFVPCYRRRDGVIGMYDLVTETFYANAGTGSFTKGADVNIPELPATYQEVKYVETTGANWIDTLVPGNNNVMSQIKFMALESSQGSSFYGGGAVGDDTKDFRYFDYESKHYLDLPGGSGSGNRIYGGTFAINTLYQLEIGNFYIKEVGASTNIASGTAVGTFTTPTIKLGYWDENHIHRSRWYYVKIYESNEMKGWFIPCKRKSDGKVGMFNLVDNTFITESGTGNLACGVEIHYKQNSNTVAFYDFDGNINDVSSNGRNFSMKSGSFTYGTVGGIKYVDFSQNAWTNGISSFPHSISAYTRSFWMKFPNYSKTGSGNYGIVLDFWKGGSNGVSRIENKNGVFTIDGINFTPPDYSKWYHYCIINDGGTAKLYVNATLVGTGALTVTDGAVTLAFNNAPDTNGSQYAGQGQMAQLICENGKWTEEYLTEYYNSTKNIFE